MNRLAAMEAFVRVVDARSFTDAARQMRVGQPAISKIIGQLEAHVGVKLMPTEGGQRFYDRARLPNAG